MIEKDSSADSVSVHARSLAYLTPLGDDLAKVMQRTVPPRQQVLHFLLPEVTCELGL